MDKKNIFEKIKPHVSPVVKLTKDKITESKMGLNLLKENMIDPAKKKLQENLESFEQHPLVSPSATGIRLIAEQTKESFSEYSTTGKIVFEIIKEHPLLGGYLGLSDEKNLGNKFMLEKEYSLREKESTLSAKNVVRRYKESGVSGYLETHNLIAAEKEKLDQVRQNYKAIQRLSPDLQIIQKEVIDLLKEFKEKKILSADFSKVESDFHLSYGKRAQRLVSLFKNTKDKLKIFGIIAPVPGMITFPIVIGIIENLWKEEEKMTSRSYENNLIALHAMLQKLLLLLNKEEFENEIKKTLTVLDSIDLYMESFSLLGTQNKHRRNRALENIWENSDDKKEDLVQAFLQKELEVFWEIEKGYFEKDSEKRISLNKKYKDFISKKTK